MHDIAIDPSNFPSHIRRAVGRTVVQVTYGHAGVNGEDYIDLAEKAQADFSISATPYMYLVDYIPLRMRRFLDNRLPIELSASEKCTYMVAIRDVRPASEDMA